MAVMSSVPVRAMIMASRRDDVPALLARIGLEEHPGAESLVDAAAFYSVVETIIADGDDDLAYRYGAAVEIDRLGVLGMAIKTAADVRSALARGERYVALLGDAVTYELRIDGDRGAMFIIGGRPASRPGIAVANEGAIAAVLSMCRQAVGADTPLVPTSVTFAHRAPPSLDAPEAFFGCPVVYGAEHDALHLSADILATPTRLGDAAISEYLVGRLDDELRAALAERGIEARVRHVIANDLADGVPPMRIVANRLGMSERTLHRRLGEGDTRYQDLVVDVRQTVATALLTTTDHTLVDIAFLTGFSEQSAFQRAFKRWTGRTPLQVRRS
ncbi:MAG: AraC family transcriptional regulator [Actinomycetota bacterium]